MRVRVVEESRREHSRKKTNIINVKYFHLDRARNSTRASPPPPPPPSIFVSNTVIFFSSRRSLPPVSLVQIIEFDVKTRGKFPFCSRPLHTVACQRLPIHDGATATRTVTCFRANYNYQHFQRHAKIARNRGCNVYEVITARVCF